MTNTTAIHTAIQNVEAYYEVQGIPAFMTEKQVATLIKLENKFHIKVLWEELFDTPSMTNASAKIANIIDAINANKVQRRRLQLNRTMDDIYNLYHPEEKEIVVEEVDKRLVVVTDYRG